MLVEVSMLDSARMMPRDVSTCWNSTFDMVDFTIDYQPVIDAITGNRDMKMQSFELDASKWVIAKEPDGMCSNFLPLIKILLNLSLRYSSTALFSFQAIPQISAPSFPWWTALTNTLRRLLTICVTPRLFALPWLLVNADSIVITTRPITQKSVASPWVSRDPYCSQSFIQRPYIHSRKVIRPSGIDHSQPPPQFSYKFSLERPIFWTDRSFKSKTTYWRQLLHAGCIAC